MTSQRGWCPALNASGNETLQFQSPSQSPAASPVRARPSSPKDKSGAAAQWSVNTASSGTKLVERVRRDRNFSHRLGLSSTISQGTKLLTAQQDNLMDFVSESEKQASGDGSLEEKAPPTLIARNAEHLMKLAKKGSLTGIKSVAVCDCAIPVDDLIELLKSEAFDSVESISLYHCLTHTDGVQRLLVELGGGAPPPVNEEEEENQGAGEEEEPEIDEETGEPIVKEEVPKEVFQPKKRIINNLNIEGNPASFGAPAGDEPSAVCLEELTKVLAKPEILPLKKLSLRSCGLTPVGATSVATALLPNGTIEVADLADNAMGKNDDGTSVTALAQLLQANKFITSVDLSDNEFDTASSIQLINAIATSNTRVATPEPADEPAPEDYVDELPEAEEAPTVKIGFPEPEKEEGADEVAEPAEGVADEDAEKEEKKADEEKADEEDEDEGEDEEEDTSAAKKEEEAEEEVDEEELERIAEEKAAAEKEAYEAAKAEWEEKQEQYIWGPQRVHAEWDETVARRDIMQEHITVTTALKNDEKADRQTSKDAQLKRELEERDRRSGWTHLNSITLDKNPLTSAGAKAIAELLRKKIPLSEEEVQSAEEAADDFVNRANEAREEAKTVREEGAENAKEEAMNAARTEMEEEREKLIAEAEEGADEPPAIDEDKINEIGEAAKEAFLAQPVDDSEIKRPEVKGDRDGVTTITRLSLNECSIGAKGLKEIATVLADNNDTLKTLLLKRNKFSVKHKEVPPPDATEDDDPPKPLLRLDVPDWISVGIQGLSDALKVNNKLVVLDLGFNGMYPANLSLLAQGLAHNNTLEVLNLDGNHLGGEEHAGTMLYKPAANSPTTPSPESEVAAAAGASSGGVFMELLSAVCKGEKSVISTFGLSSCELGPVMTTDAAKKLFECLSLKSLNLDSNSLGNEGLKNIASALSSSSPSLKLKSLTLRNNNFQTDVAGAPLGEILKNSSTLQTFAISDNHLLGDNAFEFISQAANGHPSLSTIEMRKIGITDVEPFAAAISSITFATFVDLSDNEVNPASVEKLLVAARRGASLTSLAVWGRSYSLNHLLLQALEMATACPSLVHVDIGQGIGSAITSAPVGPQDDPEDEEILPDGERLELQLLRNRLAQTVKK